MVWRLLAMKVREFRLGTQDYFHEVGACAAAIRLAGSARCLDTAKRIGCCSTVELLYASNWITVVAGQAAVMGFARVDICFVV